MTRQEIILWTCAYLVELAAVIYLTRASARSRADKTSLESITETDE